MEVWKKNSYQRKLFQIEKGEAWLDLGSNIGAFSVYAGLKGCTVQAHEADAYNADATAINCRHNGIPISVYRHAIVHDEYPDPTITFYVNARPMALRRHSIYEPKKNYDKVIVPTLRFSELPLNMVHGVKMNIEGAEIEVLEKAKGFGNIRKLVFEYSWDKDPDVARFHRIIARLKTHFRVVDYNKRVPDEGLWEHYPPNIFVYCMV